MTNSRSVTITDVFHALVTLRDRILTDKNLTTCKRVIDTMTLMLTDIINGISSEELISLQDDFTSRGLKTEYNLLKELFQTPFVQSLKSTYSKIKIEGIIEATQFIQTHLKTTISLLDDIKEVLGALHDIELYKETNPDQSSRTLQDGTLVENEELLAMYKEFLE